MQFHMNREKDELNMLLGTISSQPVRGDLKLGRRITESHERQDPDEDSDSVSLDTLKGADVHGLGAIEGQRVQQIAS